MLNMKISDNIDERKYLHTQRLGYINMVSSKNKYLRRIIITIIAKSIMSKLASLP